MYEWEATLDRLRREVAAEFVGKEATEDEVKARVAQRFTEDLDPRQLGLLASLQEFWRLRDLVG